ncbi:MAG: hypothetical protein AB7G75_24860 [Candidatus Binatia bacterium]
MAKLKAISGGKEKGKKCSLVYGLRLYPAGEIVRVEDEQVVHGDSNRSHVTLHLIEGTREQIRAQLLASIDAFFDIYGDDEKVHAVASGGSLEEGGVEESGC